MNTTPIRDPDSIGGIGNRGHENPDSIGVNRGQSGSAPRVLISSRDGAPVPEVKGARSLHAVAERAGWTALSTYALAHVPAVAYVDPSRGGAEKRPAHRVATVAVRLTRGAHRAYAVWESRDGGPWAFASAGLDWQVIGLRALTERIKGEPS